MKSKTATVILTILIFVIITILMILGVMIYKDIDKNKIINKVQEFVSNMTIEDDLVSKIETPNIIETTNSSLQSLENVNYEKSELNKYFYNQLEDYSKIIYNALYQNKEKMKSGTYEVNLGTSFSSLLSQENGEDLLGYYYQSAIEAYAYDNPDIFYLEYKKLYLNIEMTKKRNSTTYRVFINSGDQANYLVDEFLDENSVNEAIRSAETIRNYFIENRKESDYENIKTVHDYLIDSIEYDQSLTQPNIYDICGALIYKKCVCEGYAKAFKYIMDGLGIPCVMVSGQGTNSQGNTENHAWNDIQINGVWYAIDCTWDDPIVMGAGRATYAERYKYFLKGETNFRPTHSEIGQFTNEGKVFSFPNLSVNNY